MKGVLSLEVKGDELGAVFHGMEKIQKAQRTYWVAEITGFDPKYRFKREFVKPKIDYTNASGSGKSGVVKHYIMDSANVYDVSWRKSRGKAYRFYAKVDNDGEIIEVSEDEVIAVLKRRDEGE